MKNNCTICGLTVFSLITIFFILCLTFDKQDNKQENDKNNLIRELYIAVATIEDKKFISLCVASIPFYGTKSRTLIPISCLRKWKDLRDIKY